MTKTKRLNGSGPLEQKGRSLRSGACTLHVESSKFSLGTSCSQFQDASLGKSLGYLVPVTQ